MDQPLQLEAKEIKFVKKLYKIRKELGEIQKYQIEAIKQVEQGTAQESIRAEWARMKFKQLCLQKAEKAMFCPEAVPERERVELDD